MDLILIIVGILIIIWMIGGFEFPYWSYFIYHLFVQGFLEVLLCPALYYQKRRRKKMNKLPNWLKIALIIFVAYLVLKSIAPKKEAISYGGLSRGGLVWGASGACEWRNGQCASSKSNPCISGSCKVSSSNICSCGWKNVWATQR